MKRVGGAPGLFGLGAGLAPFFLYLELLKAVRSSQWGGILPSDWAGLGFGALFYGLILGGATLAIGTLLGRVRAHLAGFAVLVAGLIVWGLLSVHREETPTLDDGIVGGAVLAISLAACYGLWSGRFTAGRLGMAMAVWWLGGLSALYAAGEYFLFSPSRARDVTLYPAMWLLPLGTVVGCLLLCRPRRGLFPAVGLAGLALPLVGLGITLHAPPRSDSEGRPNMIFLISDTLRADYCSAYGGNVPTPHLEALAADGVRFERHYALAPWTLPSLTGLFSSHYPKSLTPDSDHKAWILQMNQYEVDYSQPTLPMRLEEAGYRTGAFTANAFLPVVPGMMLGYQDRASSHPILLEDNGYFNQLPFLSDAFRAWCPPLVDIRPHNTTVDLDHYARAFLRRHRDKPFFLWIHYIDPHAPYDPPEELRRIPEGPWPFFHPYVGGEAWDIPILGKNFEIAPKDQDYVRSLYEGEVTYIDRFVGRIRDALTAAGLAESTYFCFTSDHGEELWDHGDWGHGQSLHDELVRVPLIMSGPNISPRTIPEPVSAIDLIPTLADLLGVAPVPGWRGKSLAPVLHGERSVSTDTPVFANGTSNKSVTNPQHMVVQGKYKLIRLDGRPEISLYDLEADPGEVTNIAAENPDIVATMTQLLEDWLASFPAYFDVSPVEFNREMEQGLEGMGYL